MAEQPIPRVVKQVQPKQGDPVPSIDPFELTKFLLALTQRIKILEAAVESLARK